MGMLASWLLLKNNFPPFSESLEIIMSSVFWVFGIPPDHMPHKPNTIEQIGTKGELSEYYRVITQ